MKYRIVKKEDGKYYAQIKTWFLSGWDDLFNAGALGIVKYSAFQYAYGRHNNRGNNTIEQCEQIVEIYKSMIKDDSYENIKEVVENIK